MKCIERCARIVFIDTALIPAGILREEQHSRSGGTNLLHLYPASSDGDPTPARRPTECTTLPWSDTGAQCEQSAWRWVLFHCARTWTHRPSLRYASPLFVMHFYHCRFHLPHFSLPQRVRKLARQNISQDVPDSYSRITIEYTSFCIFISTHLHSPTINQNIIVAHQIHISRIVTSNKQNNFVKMRSHVVFCTSVHKVLTIG